ncbi:hypothetical protein H6758_05045 [Candidatus Nomurabacteria bacterium]|nr:hypothetical protein [Candidatus Nomurabacteria bacterium]
MKKFVSTFSALSLCLILMGSGCFSFGGSSNSSAPGRSGPGGMFVSLDKGETWTANSRLPKADGVKSLQSLNVFKLFQDPSDPEAMYWSATGRGMVYTYDGGRSWAQPAAVTGGTIYDVAVHPKDRCTIYITNGKIISRTTDCSRHFETVLTYERDQIRSVDVDPFNVSTITAVTEKGIVLQSKNAGVSWDRIATFSRSVQVRDVYYDQFTDGLLYMATLRHGLYVSENGGDSWKSKREAIADFAKANEYRRLYLHPSKPDTLFWISRYGILKSEDRGDSWKAYELVTQPGVALINSFVVNKDNDQEMYYVAEVGSKGSLYYSSDGGNSWTTKKLPSDQMPTWLHLHPEDQGRLYLGFTIILPQ